MDFVDVVILIQQWFYQTPSIWACIQPLFFTRLCQPFLSFFNTKKTSQTSPRNFNFSPTQPWGLWRPSWVSKKNNGGPAGFAHVNSNSIHLFKSQLPSLKLTWPLKIEGWKMRFPSWDGELKRRTASQKTERGFKFLFRFFLGGGMDVHDPDCNRFTFSSDFHRYLVSSNVSIYSRKWISMCCCWFRNPAS